MTDKKLSQLPVGTAVQGVDLFYCAQSLGGGLYTQVQQPMSAIGTYLVTASTATADPTGTIGLTAVNGVAVTAMRSDAAPPLDQAILPTWTGLHTFRGTVDIGAADVIAIVNARFATAPCIVAANTNAFVGAAINNWPPGTVRLPCGVTGFGQVLAGSNGNPVWGIFGSAELYTNGVATHELSIYNFAGTGTSTIPQVLAIGTTGFYGNGLQITAGGDFPSSIGLTIGSVGVNPQPWQYGIYLKPNQILLNGIWVNANATGAPVTSIIADNSGEDGHVNLQLQTKGILRPDNPVIKVLAADNSVTTQLTQDGTFTTKNIFAGHKQRSVTASPITVAATDQIINCNIASGSPTCTLPLASTRAGVPLTFKDVGNQFSAHNLTLTPTAPDLIDGMASYVLRDNYSGVRLVPLNDGVNSGWFIG